MDAGKAPCASVKRQRLHVCSPLWRLPLIAVLASSFVPVNSSWFSISKPDQVTGRVHGLVGQNVLLKCVYASDFPLPENVTVFWYKQGKPVLYILDGVPSAEYQDQMFTGRVLSFPDVYKDRNFSIILKDIQLSDSGSYDCIIPTVGFKTEVRLTVSVARRSRGHQCHLKGGKFWSRRCHRCSLCTCFPSSSLCRPGSRVGPL